MEGPSIIAPGGPEADGAAEFQDAVEELLDAYGVDATSRFRDLDGLTVQVLEAGEGEPLLYLHGHGATQAHLANLLPALTERFRVVAPTRPEIGLSDRVDIKGHDVRRFSTDLWRLLLDELGLDRVAVMGNSLGGLEATWLALDAPERVDRIVLLGGVPGYGPWLPAFFRLSSVPGLNTFLHEVASPPGPDTTEKMMAFLTGHPERVPEVQKDLLTETMSDPASRKAWRRWTEELVSLGGIPRYDTMHELSRIACPVLLLWGSADTNCRLAAGQEAAERIPDADLVVLEGAGHLPWLDEPERCEQEILTFLRRD